MAKRETANGTTKKAGRGRPRKTAGTQKAAPEAGKTKKYEVPEGASAWDESGPGRKQCPGCQKYVPSPTRTCKVCEHEFTKGKKPKAIATTGNKPSREPKNKPEALSTTESVEALFEAVEAVGGIDAATRILQAVAKSRSTENS